MMRLFVTNLLIATLLVLPLQAWGSQVQCHCGDLSGIQVTEQGAVEIADACCSSDFDEHDGQHDRQPKPCQDQNCPSDCCSLNISSAFVLLVAPRVAIESTEIHCSQTFEETIRSSAHLLRLKRPPKSA